MKKKNPSFEILPSLEKERNPRLTKLDYIVLSCLIVVYSLFAFINLGTMNFPTSMYKSEEQTSATLDFGNTVEIQGAWVNASICDGSLTFTAEDGSECYYDLEYGNMYRWRDADVTLTTRYLIVTASDVDILINELAFFDADGNVLSVTEVGTQTGLVDEQDTIPESRSYLNGMYFDEIYHARTAFENLNNMYVYEWTHPPLGKLIISVGIAIFGMTPFGWRFMGALFGVLMLPILYVFAKRIFKRTDFSLIMTALFAFDCMHFTQTRIATIDTYGVFFILLMYLFMYEYITMDHEKTPFWKTLVPLGLCGLSFALGISSKWIGFYAAAGLAVLLFSFWGRRLYDIIVNRKREKLALHRVNWAAFLPVVFVLVMLLRSIADKRNNNWYEGIWNAEFLFGFITCVFVAIAATLFYSVWNRSLSPSAKKLNRHFMILPICCVFFILIPAAIYIASFMPYYRYDALSNPDYGFKDAIDTMWRNQTAMYRYHSTLSASHSSATMWYQWPFTAKSTWFYSSAGSWISNISTTGNIFVWWAGFVGFFLLMMDIATSKLKHGDWSLRIGCILVIVEYIVFLIAYNLSPAGQVPTVLFIIMMFLTVGALALSKEVTVKTLCIAFIANYLPWALVSRCVFIYHFFATVPFILLAAGFFLMRLEERNPRLKLVKWIWLGLGLLYFLLMLPAISGIPMPRLYARFIEYFLPGGDIFHGTV
ncbi:MAG: glycosyltransferase family 39 protein [Clostridia bacterium]|nr:glycosyltransferase family 39 protein [Clostridia bacterium]